MKFFGWFKIKKSGNIIRCEYNIETSDPHKWLEKKIKRFNRRNKKSFQSEQLIVKVTTDWEGENHVSRKRK